MNIVDPAINDYLLAHSEPADGVLRDLAEETRRELGGRAGMQITQDEGELLTMLVRLSGARQAVEVGTFTGYSSICIARGLPDDGQLLCCDVSEAYTSVARRYWDRAGVSGKIELRIAPAAGTLSALPDEPCLDFAFIDADKAGYAAYVEQIVPRLREGGLMVLDNMLWSGGVLEPRETTRAPSLPSTTRCSPTNELTWCYCPFATESAWRASVEHGRRKVPPRHDDAPARCSGARNVRRLQSADLTLLLMSAA